MATIYCRSTDGNDGDSGATWALAKATLAAAITAAGNAGTVYVSQVHAETAASAKTHTAPTTAANCVKIYCVDDSAEPPTALATTATVTTTGNNNIQYTGYAYCYGITFSAGSGAVTAYNYFNGNSTPNVYWIMEACSIKKAGTSSGTAIFIQCNTRECVLDLINTTLSFGNVGDSIYLGFGCGFFWRNTPSALLGTIPTTLFAAAGGSPKRIEIIGVDLSAADSGKNLFNATGELDAVLIDCKLGASVTVSTGSFKGPRAANFELFNCDSADTNYRRYSQRYEGSMAHETIIVRSGGATDGTTARSLKIVSAANTSFHAPFYSEWMPFWNDGTGSAITVAIPVITDNVTLTDAQAWIEVEGQTTSGFPIGAMVSDRATDVLATPANQTTDATSSWTTTGLATPVQQVLSTSITPQEKGWVRARVVLAKASTTMYFDPAPINGSWVKYATKARMHEGGVMQAEDASAGGGVFSPFPGQ